MNIKFILILGLTAFGIYYWYDGRPVTHKGKGQVAKEQPRQTATKAKVFTFGDDFLITPLADFEITARVLSRERYWLGTEAELAPVDLALGWGPMSDDKVLSELKISQRNRWFYWKCRKYPIPRDQIEHNAANMHLIPADDGIESLIKSVKTGSIVRFRGHLVRINRPDGWHWESSMSRTDTGDHACEVVFVKEFEILN
ncbi:MAG TPA: hypothetical protein PKW56_05530 [Clostridiales bacterium]|nr:hypothetical protein [Clostridiales bacterium]